MKLLSERNQVREVLGKWRAQYPDRRYTFGSHTRVKAQTAGDIEDQLAALNPEKATAKDVERIIGNSWCGSVDCDECGVQSYECVTLGQEPDHESCTANICARCLRKALQLIAKASA